jgi:hypothetical protein
MDFTDMLTDAFTYTREGVWGNMNRWMKLVLAVICLGIPYNGYVLRVYRGAKPAPDVDQWGTLFIDGLKMLAIGIVYAIPLMILWAFIYGQFFLGLLNGTMDESALATWEPNFVLMMIFYVVELAVVVVIPVAMIRFARTGIFGEAFNFSGIFGTIRRIGWINYLVALFLVSIIVSIPVMVIIFGFIIAGGISLFMLKEGGFVAFLALLALAILVILILSPLIGVFQARYMTRLYDCAAPAEPAVS